MDEQGSNETTPANPPAEPTPVASNDTPAAPAPEASAPAAKPAEINKIDLSALSGFSFGTQWTSTGDRREGRDRGPRRDDEGPRSERRDRRPARRPMGEGSDASAAGAAAPAGERPFRGDRRGFAPRGDRPAGGEGRSFGPRGGGEFRGEGGAGGGRPFRGERRDFGPRGEGGERREFGPRGEGRGRFEDQRPYLSPYFEVAFYAEDTAFTALVKAVRASCHTYELFEIARVVLGKAERFVVVVQRKADAEGKRTPIFVTPVDGMPFENEDEAVQHVLRNHLGAFFTMTEVEVEPPKGNFQFINRCSITGELLGPPNHHRYQHILQQHHASRLANMPFERFRERIETVKDPELINQWVEKMKKATRYVWKTAAEAEAAPTFDTLEDARTHLLAHARDKVVRTVDHARFHGKVVETMPKGEIRAAIEGHLERQRRFPLDTANSLRGRLRREGFTIFKRGAKGVSYVCSVKRKFRVPGQVFSESIGGLISFVEANPFVSVKELPEKHLGIKQPEGAATASSAAAPAEGAAPAPAAAPVPAEDAVRLKRLWMDLRWLVTEGYVTEYSDGKLFAPPPMTPQQQKSEEAANAAADAAEDAAREAVEAAPAAEAAAEAPAEAAPETPAEPAPETPPAAPETGS